MTVIPSSTSVVLSTSRLEARALGDGSNEDQNNQSVLQHLYFIVAVFLAILIVFRVYLLRKRHRPVRDFFSITPTTTPQAHDDHAFGSSYQHSSLMPLAPLPLAHYPDRRTHAADIDSAGRRIGGPDDPDWNGKDILPAYSNIDRPPKYDSSPVFLQGYIPPHGTNPSNDSAAANTEALPTAEQPSADTTSMVTLTGLNLYRLHVHQRFLEASSLCYDS